jgi:hypothetical protein
MTSTAEISRRRMRAARSVAVSRQVAGSLISARDAARRSREARASTARVLAEPRSLQLNAAGVADSLADGVAAYGSVAQAAGSWRVARRTRRRQVPAPNGMLSSRVGSRRTSGPGGRAGVATDSGPARTYTLSATISRYSAPWRNASKRRTATVARQRPSAVAVRSTRPSDGRTALAATVASLSFSSEAVA